VSNVSRTMFDWTSPGGGSRTVKVGDTTIVYGFDGASAEVISIRTPITKRGDGSARRAMTTFLVETDTLGIPVKLSSSPLDKRTRDDKLFNFYRSLGFEPTGRRINPAGDPEMVRQARPAQLSAKLSLTQSLKATITLLEASTSKRSHKLLASSDDEGEAMEIDGHKVHIHKEKAKYSRESLSPKQTVYVITDDVSGDIITDPATTKRSAVEQARRALALIYVAKEPISGAAEDEDPISLDNIGEGYFTDEEIGKFLQEQGAEQLTVMGKRFPDYWILGDKIIDWDGDNVYPDVESCEEFLSDAPSIVDDVAAILETQSVEEMAEYPPSEVYHATSSDNVDDILADGLLPMSKTRVMTNRSVGASVFTTMNKDSAFSGTYGDSVFSINTAQMKTDGVLPVMMSEPSVYEMEAYSVLAHVLGLDGFDAPIESDGADDPDTVIIHGAIAPKYLKLLDNE
jgi:hypothetical protein